MGVPACSGHSWLADGEALWRGPTQHGTVTSPVPPTAGGTLSPAGRRSPHYPHPTSLVSSELAWPCRPGDCEAQPTQAGCWGQRHLLLAGPSREPLTAHAILDTAVRLVQAGPAGPAPSLCVLRFPGWPEAGAAACGCGRRRREASLWPQLWQMLRVSSLEGCPIGSREPCVWGLPACDRPAPKAAGKFPVQDHS